MKRYTLVVMTNALDNRDDEFNNWYSSVHMLDMLKVPGFKSARRLSLSDVQNPARPPCPYRYLALYEVETDDLDAILEEIAARYETPRMLMNDSMDRNLFAYYFEALP